MATHPYAFTYSSRPGSRRTASMLPPFFRRNADPAPSTKRQKKAHGLSTSSNSFINTLHHMGFLQAPSALRLPKRTKSSTLVQTPQDDLDEFLSSDLELSFASTMSLHSPPQPQHELAPESSDAMDISPVRPRHASAEGEHTAKLGRLDVAKAIGRQRAATSSGRLFARDVTNESASRHPLEHSKSDPSAATTNAALKVARPTLPTGWIASSYANEESNVPPSPADSDMMMDVDSGPLPSSAPEPSSPISAARTITGMPSSATWNPSAPGQWSASPSEPAFADLSSPAGPPSRTYNAPVHVFSPGAPSPAPKKVRRSLSPETPARSKSDDLSDKSSSQLRRMKSSSLLAAFQAPTEASPGGVFGTLAPAAPVFAPVKRLRRPALAAIPSGGDSSRYPMLGSTSGLQPSRLAGLAAAAPRRAFSAVGPAPTMLDEGSSFENSMEMSSPAQMVVRRQATRTLRRCDGAEELRPSSPPRAMPPPAVSNMESPSARYMASSGLPGFGDNESLGKILPCHRVKEDGLMRINPTTLNLLLDGKYNDKIAEYRVIDCRFEYEYAGGHIPGAININTTAGVEEALLSNSFAPRPSMSADGSRKTILIFHCEFSAKRGPTFAKHLRSKDRSMNNHCYPRIHYPEVYVLEGGYCQYFKEAATRCVPQAYVRMDDPVHAVSRKEDLDQFRRGKFGRTKSYAYGDVPGAGAAKLLSAAANKRAAAPAGPPAVFAAANAARTRRPQKSQDLAALTEDGDMTAGEEDETDIGDSPCPPPTKTGGLNFKVKKVGRAPLMRAETCGPLRLAF